MYEEDNDGKILNQIDTIADEVDVFKEKITNYCQQIIEEGLVRLQVHVQPLIKCTDWYLTPRGEWKKYFFFKICSRKFNL